MSSTASTIARLPAVPVSITPDTSPFAADADAIPTFRAQALDWR
jgi:hypothetical protein